MQRAYTLEAVVLKRKNLAEADKLLTIFSEYKGKLIVIAKGIRKIHSRKAPHLELFNHVKVLISSGRTWDYLVEAETIENFTFLRSQIERISQAFQLIEEIDRLCGERQVHKNIFHWLILALRQLDDKNLQDSAGVVEEFTLQILWDLGYLPHDKILMRDNLFNFLEEVMEKSLKSRRLLVKI